jgi:GNAT superfamily N-acetyltransferase
MNDINFDHKAIEALVVGNQDLERLESLLDQFNIFEAIGAVHVEIRHSTFLSFLLDPSQNHGLGDIFVKRLLQKALANALRQTLPVTPIDLDIWDLDGLMVQREWQNIDIFLTDDRNRLAVIIENKIDGSEHGEQLQRYRKIVNQLYPNWHIVGLYLTPEGDQPTDDLYLPVDYLSICEILEQLAETRSITLGPDIRIAILHYTQMLRRHIVSESEIADLCQQIYRKHQRALDLIYEYRTDQQAAIQDILVNLISEQPKLELDHTSKSYIRFAVKEWDAPILLQGEGWTLSKRMLLFEFKNYVDRLALHFLIGPGPNDIRQRILDMAHAHTPLLRPSQHALGKKWNAIFVRPILLAKDYEDTTAEEIEVEIRKKWLQFIEHDLPQITSILKSESWIWEK